MTLATSSRPVWLVGKLHLFESLIADKSNHIPVDVATRHESTDPRLAKSTVLFSSADEMTDKKSLR